MGLFLCVHPYHLYLFPDVFYSERQWHKVGANILTIAIQYENMKEEVVSPDEP